MVSIIKHSLMVTVFVFVMMIIVDYLNVISRGKLKNIFIRKKFIQYVVASFLGATPGCLGVFMTTSMYIHGLLSFGAMVATMIATSGDEAYVMLVLFPAKALFLFFLLFICGIAFGWIADMIAHKMHLKPCEKCRLQVIHEEEYETGGVPSLSNFLKINFIKGILLIFILFFIFLLITGMVGPKFWDWKKITFTVLLGISLFITLSSSNHYIFSHIVNHIVKKHLWKVFLWTFGTLFFIHLGTQYFNLQEFVKTHMGIVLLLSALLGIIPESGPHLIFVIMFSQGLIPFSVLFTSSFVQDGHGMLPLLSYTVKDSLLIKAFNLVFGLLVGSILYFAGL